MKALGRFLKPRIIQSVLGILFVLTAWVIFLPTQFGGKFTYIIVTGNSMEPLFHQGDFVIADSQADFNIGDVVVYIHPDIGRVIHRIIDREGEYYILKGDNNSWIDGYQPTRAEISGKYRFLIPKIGSVFQKLRQPWLFSLFSGASVLILGVSMVNTPKQRKKTKLEKSDFLHSFAQKMSQWKDSYWFPVYIIGLGCLVLGIFSFTKPIDKTINNEITYTQQGIFSYSGAASQDVYDQNVVKSGDPVYTSLTCSIDLSFDYQVSSTEEVIGGGSYQLSTILRGSNGWTRTIQEAQLTSFEGTTLHAQQTLNLCEVQEYATYVGETTGVDRQQLFLEIVPEVSFTGTVNGSLIQEEFSPILTFHVEEGQVYLLEDTGSDSEDPLVSVEEGYITVETIVPNTLNILGLELPVRLGRIISAVGVFIFLIGLIVPFISFQHAKKKDPRLADRLEFGQMLVEVNYPPVGAQDQVIEVSKLDDLLLLAEKSGTVVMTCQQSEATDYYVQIERRFYHHKKTNPVAVGEVSG